MNLDRKDKGLNVSRTCRSRMGRFLKFRLQRPNFKNEPRLKYGLFCLKLYSMFQDLSRRSIKTGFWRI